MEAKRRKQSNPRDVSVNVSCAVLKSETVLNVKNDRVNFFVFWYKFCDDTSLYFRPTLFVNNVSWTKEEFIKLSYNWYRENRISNWQKNIKPFYFPLREFSWKMAADVCQKNNWTLPHFKDKKSALDFIVAVLNGVDYPTFVTFVGLMNKVKQFVFVSNSSNSDPPERAS